MRDIVDDSDVPADALGRVFARTRYSKQAFEHLDALLRMPMDRNHAWGTAFLGEARLGKTTLVAEYLKSCLAGEDGRRPLKHLYVRLTSDAKPATIAYTTLDWIRDPSPAYGGPAQRSSRVWNAIERNRYDIIIYDEAHYLVASDTLTVEEKGVSWFNELLNQRRCPLVLIGYERLGHAIRRNPSLEGRIRPFPACKPLDYADSDDLNEAAYVLSRLERHLDFPTPSGLARRQVAERICYLCGQARRFCAFPHRRPGDGARKRTFLPDTGRPPCHGSPHGLRRQRHPFQSVRRRGSRRSPQGRRQASGQAAVMPALYNIPEALDPLEDESMTGLAMRYAEPYRFMTPERLFDRLGLKRQALPTLTAFDPSSPEAAAVAALLNLTPDQAALMCNWHPGPKSVSVGGRRLFTDVTDIHTRQCCPLCLAQSPHHRSFWLIAAVPVCHVHGTLLTRICPRCESVLAWRGAGPHRCANPDCCFDLAEAEPVVVPEASRLAAAGMHDLYDGQPHPSGLDLDGALLASLAIGRLLLGFRSAGRSRLSAFVRKQRGELAGVLAAGWAALDPWPAAYHAFLEGRLERAGLRRCSRDSRPPSGSSTGCSSTAADGSALSGTNSAGSRWGAPTSRSRRAGWLPWRPGKLSQTTGLASPRSVRPWVSPIARR